MSVNRVVLPLILVTLVVLAGCSGSSGPTPIPPPSGGFSNSNLNGTYVFSVLGTDVNGASYTIVGQFTANGSGGNGTGGITAGTLDINDEDTTTFTNGPLAKQQINAGNSSYTVGVDGRGEVKLNTSTPFGTITLNASNSLSGMA